MSIWTNDTIASIDPRSGRAAPSAAKETGTADVDAIAAAAERSAAALETVGRSGRSRLLDAMADALEASADRLVAICLRETGLPDQRLRSELARTAYQLRFLGAVALEGSYLDLTVDHARETAMGRMPDLRLMNVPIGVVAVFAASNFPFAFSVGGGDVASALAAGCPVVVKAHSSHPETSLETFGALRRGITQSGLPEEVIGIVFGREAGIALVAHPAIHAVGFTGSVAGGRALATVASGRPDPIPFFGELGSTNPLVVTSAAAVARADAIGRGAVESFTLGAGQFCTKPGLLFVPRGAAGDALVNAARAATRATAAGFMLNEGIFHAYCRDVDMLADLDGVVSTDGALVADAGFSVRARLLETDARAFRPELTEECFGPAAVVVRYDTVDELIALLTMLPGALTATIHAEEGDPDAARVLPALRRISGRLVWNGYPTGVAVTWAMHHGGPWPSAVDARQTSVGAYGIRRWVRPVCWQNTPADALPQELRDDTAGIPRRVDGVLRLV